MVYSIISELSITPIETKGAASAPKPFSRSVSIQMDKAHGDDQNESHGENQSNTNDGVVVQDSDNDEKVSQKFQFILVYALKNYCYFLIVRKTIPKPLMRFVSFWPKGMVDECFAFWKVLT